MGIRFRKSKNFGPFRINLSKSGIGYSFGVKGARITKKANGGTRTTAYIPGTGISYVEDHPSASKVKARIKEKTKTIKAEKRYAKKALRKEYGLSRHQIKKLERKAKRPEQFYGKTDEEILKSVGWKPTEKRHKAPRSQQSYSKKESSGHSILFYIIVIIVIIVIIKKIFGQ